ncbi:unnamed protein product [Brachionus calyciflorus]|uniref:G-protein coupled receptors family 1 profile domain-containing protein n=1 Tax=Brachionus calyciflorus TaxID=104777 RepID=A0A813P5J2_9BILA|nr:unnamed protein product [Brachionus calyciflorus]
MSIFQTSLSYDNFLSDSYLQEITSDNQTTSPPKIYNFESTETKTKTDLLISVLQQETSLVWIIFGTIGNLLSLFVLLRPKMRIHSTFTYLTILAVCDTLVLYFGLLRDFLVNKYNYDINGDILCKFHVFSFYFVLHMASWLLVAVNIDRLIAASFLSLSKKWCTPRTAIRVSTYLAIFLMIINSHFLYYVDSEDEKKSTENYELKNFFNSKNLSIRSISKNYNDDHSFGKVRSKNYFLFPSLNENDYYLNDLYSSELTIPEEEKPEVIMEPVNPYVYKKCLIKANSPLYSYFFQKIFTWIDASAQVILPFIIMVVCNINIIHKVLLTKNKTNGKNLKRLRKIKGMCVMIVSVSVIFFILEAPILIFICLIQGSYIQSTWPYIELFWTIMNLMMYTNHVINFLSYCMTGTKFRRELLRLLSIHIICKSLTNYKNLFTSHFDHNNVVATRHNEMNKCTSNLNQKEKKTIVKFFNRNNQNFKTEPIVKNNLVKPVSLTSGILNKKRMLGESATAWKRKKSSDSNLFVQNDRTCNLVDSDFRPKEENIAQEADNNFLVNENVFSQRRSLTKISFKNLSKFGRKSKKRPDVLSNSERVDFDDLDIQLDEDTGEF